jgi:hypothetical protein
MLHLRAKGDRQKGQILVLFELVFIVIIAFAALVIDIGILRNNKQTLINTMNAAALAGGSALPANGATGAATVNTLINSSIKANDSLLVASSTGIGTRCMTGADPAIGICDYTITYKCLIGVDSTNKPYVARDVPGVCDPTHAVGHTPLASDFSGAGNTRVAACRPDLGDKCNTVVVAGAADTQYSLAPVVGINSGSTGMVVAAACNGPCGASPTVPVDLVILIDRTASMSTADVTATRNAANAVLGVYDPGVQRVGLGFIGPSSTSTTCSGSPTGIYGKALTSGTGYGTTLPVAGSPGNLKNWLPIGLSGNTAPITGDPVGFNEAYKLANGSLNSASHIVAAINCFDNPGGTGTNLAAPIRMARAYLDLYGRPGVRWGIILETDGQPSAPSPVLGAAADYTCAGVNNDATAAKADSKAPGGGIEIFTIGFGLDGSNNTACPDSSGAFKGKTATYLLASAANQPSSDKYGCPGSGATNSNNDGDHFFCQPKTTDLTMVFSAVATTFAGGRPHLVQIYPAPVVTGAGGAAASVSISGEYFTGAVSVYFGGGLATSFTVNGDTSITAKAPTGTSGSTVDVIVVTAGGSSVVTSSDQYKYP